VSVWEKEMWNFLETKENDVKMGWMNGIPWVDCHTLEARTIVIEQESWEISILSQLKTELMCRLS